MLQLSTGIGETNGAAPNKRQNQPCQKGKAVTPAKKGKKDVNIADLTGSGIQKTDESRTINDGSSSELKSREVKDLAHEFGLRLFSIRKHKGVTQREMASDLGINLLTYTRYEKGERIPDILICSKIVRKFEVNPDWLLFGGNIEWRDDKSEKENQNTKLPENYALVPVYELAGPSFKKKNTLIEKTPVDKVPVPKSLLSPGVIAVIYRDSNMVPHITPGAIVGINTTLRDTPMGHVYAIWMTNIGTRLYRVFARTIDDVSLRSDNVAEPDISIKATEFKKIVLGRLEWLFQAW